MVFTDEEALALVKEQSKVAPKWVDKAREQSNVLFALVEGEKFDELLIKRIEFVESEKKATARIKYSRNVTDLFERLLLPIANVFNSSGGSVKYELVDKDEAQTKEFLSAIANLKDGKSVGKYVEDSWMPLYHTDPNGVVFMEYRTGNNPKAWPTYKSIGNIRNYQRKGQLTEWILFEPKPSKSGKKLWRFVDDETDRTFIQNGHDFTLSEALSFKHPFGETPALINSDIIDVKTRIRLSPLNKVVELSKEYARDQSFKSIFKAKKANPIFWRLTSQCVQCTGVGKVGNKKCPSCNGKGKYTGNDVTDVLEVPVPKNSDQPKLVPDVAGFVESALETWKQFAIELQDEEILVQDTYWGTHKEPGKNETATGRFIDINPVMNKLGSLADTAEFVWTKIVNWEANFVFTSKPKNESIGTVALGRRYIIDPPDVLLEKYTAAKTAGENNVVLDRMFNEYLMSKYKNDPEWLAVELKKSQVEPYLHITLKDVKDIFGDVEAQRKVFFKEWWDINSDNLVDTKIESVREKFKEDFGKTINTNIE